ncbi:MAG: hypothetical protein LCH53_04435 [Bacteroidetes bacterium]|nr:hypothetical protein [Bacteroidota bacterium]
MTTVRTTSTRVNYAANEPHGLALAANAARAGLVVTNVTGTTCYLLFGTDDASDERFTYALGPGDVLEMTNGVVYDGAITYGWANATNGFLMVSEWLRVEA